MYVPEPVVSLSIRPKGSESSNFGKALSRFVREDPTFRVHVDAESSETIIRGMGELHLEIYVERMRREYSVETVTGRPQVNYREAILQGADFNCVYRRQSGGRGEFAKIIGRIEPIEGKGNNMEFVNETVGGVIDKGFMTATRKVRALTCR
jgi:elongation factor G